MFEDYLQDAYSFYSLAGEQVGLNKERQARMFFRASVFCAASSLEAFVNFVGETFKQGGNLDKNEIAFLNDRVLEVSVTKAIIEDKFKMSPIEGKIKFIIKKFAVPLDIITSGQWRGFLEFKEFRNELIHSKSISDEKSLNEYLTKIQTGLNANIDIMNAISMKIFNKPLRRSLVDLKI